MRESSLTTRGATLLLGCVIGVSAMAFLGSRAEQDGGTAGVAASGPPGVVRARPPTSTGSLSGEPRSRAPAPSEPDARTLETEFLRGQLRGYEGVEQAWKEGEGHGAFAPKALLSTLERTWAGRVRVTSMECDEYPCIVSIALPPGSSECCADLVALLPPPLNERVGYAFVQFTDDGSGSVLLPFGDPEDWSDDADVRTHWRVQGAATVIKADAVSQSAALAE